MTILRSGAALLMLFAILAIAAPWLAPHDPNLQLDPAAGRFLPPGSSRVALTLGDGSTRLAESVSEQGGALSYLRLGTDHVLAADALAAPPRTLFFPLGTDQFGRDVA
ncbi:MAG: hypothetical protein KC457_34970, partial [Myxococcales bacterium]|nr:hypothetical protein [Myxococcales bacterium]